MNILSLFSGIEVAAIALKEFGCKIDNYFNDATGKPLISSTQIYKSVGNSFTKDVVKHILSFLPVANLYK